MTQRSWTREDLDLQAALLSKQDARAALSVLGALGGLASTSPDADAGAEVPIGDDYVCIWKRAADASGAVTFTRAPELSSQWGFWANTHRIAAKGARKRVLLLGESAARGFLYDPSFNLATAIEAQLKQALGENRIEVIDLARLGLSAAGLRAVMRAAPALDPDLVVIYAGNNWRTGAATQLSWSRRVARAGALLDGGVAALKQQCEYDLAEDVREMMRVASATLGTRVPLVFVIPEVNLADWKDRDVAPGLLGSDCTTDWWLAREQVARTLGAGDRAEAGALVARLLELDRGTCAESLYLHAEQQRSLNRPASEVRRAFEDARDASVWNPRVLPSRTLRVMQETLRTECERHGYPVVDLPQQFAAHLGDGLPDRRLFLDNCHLSHEGICLTAALTTATVLPLLGGPTLTASDVLRSTPLPISSACEASAHFAAAIINAHCGQRDDLVEFHCERALRSNSAIDDAIADYIELALRVAPGWMCAALERIASRNTQLALAGMIVGNLASQPKLMDSTLFATTARLLGPEAVRRLDALRVTEPSARGARTPLHDPRFALDAIGMREADNIVGDIRGWPDVFRAYSPRSTFMLVKAEPRAVQLQLCARLDRTQRDGEIVVEVNGVEHLRSAIGRAWQTWDVQVPESAIRTGVNHVTVHWPIGFADSGIDRAVEQLRRGDRPELFPVFGEVHSLWATHL